MESSRMVNSLCVHTYACAPAYAYCRRQSHAESKERWVGKEFKGNRWVFLIVHESIVYIRLVSGVQYSDSIITYIMRCSPL